MDVIKQAKFPLSAHIQLILLSIVFGAGFKVIALNSWKAVVLILLFTIIYTTWSMLNEMRLKGAPKYKLWWLLILFILNMYIGEWIGMGISGYIIHGQVNVSDIALAALAILFNWYCLHRLRRAWNNSSIR